MQAALITDACTNSLLAASWRLPHVSLTAAGTRLPQRVGCCLSSTRLSFPICTVLKQSLACSLASRATPTRCDAVLPHLPRKCTHVPSRGGSRWCSSNSAVSLCLLASISAEAYRHGRRMRFCAGCGCSTSRHGGCVRRIPCASLAAACAKPECDQAACVQGRR